MQTTKNIIKMNDLTSKVDFFMKTFKYYKSNKPKPSLDEVVSVGDCCNVSNAKVNSIILKNIKEDARTELLGLQKLNKWQLYSFRDHPGLLMIKNPFTNKGQRYWIRKCLEEYPKKPNKTNLDIEMCLQDWWAECYDGEKCRRLLQKKLRWTTLGYHHNWNTKVYSEENKSAFPEDLAELSDVVARYLGYSNFKAEAAIVNYYHMDSTLSAHTDHSEANLEAPLFSFSFGQSAIFLIGGQEKNTEPSAILLNSGDVVVMSKEARLCYHAVPKILPAPSEPWNEHDDDAASDVEESRYIKNREQIVSLMNENSLNTEWSKFSSYIEESRINMNVRQVLNENQNNLMDF